MLEKQYTSFRYRSLVILFLFFNCVCTAAPFIKATSENYKQVLPIQLAQSPNTAETEEESRLTGASYVNQLAHFSFRKQRSHFFHNSGSNINTAILLDIGSEKSYLTPASFLPTPGYYAFLFRYNLF
jgi:hypothetical protein